VSFFKKIKQGLGIGTVKLTLEVPSSVSWESSKIQGKVTVTAKSDQQISSFKFKLTEEFTTGRGENKETQEFELGTASYDQPVELKAGESKTIEFSLPFALRKSPAPPLSEKGSARGVLGKAAKFASGDKSDYRVRAEAKIQGTMLSPDDSKFIEIV
jgi:sporulation-control protein spo0M